MESARLDTTEVRRALASWNVARESGDVGRKPHRRRRRSERCQIRTPSAFAAPLELAEGQTSGWHIATLVEPWYPRRYISRAMMQKRGPNPGCMSCHVSPGGHSDASRSRFERSWADEDAIQAAAERRNDDGESVGHPTSEWGHREVRGNPRQLNMLGWALERRDLRWTHRRAAREH